MPPFFAYSVKEQSDDNQSDNESEKCRNKFAIGPIADRRIMNNEIHCIQQNTKKFQDTDGYGTSSCMQTSATAFVPSIVMIEV